MNFCFVSFAVQGGFVVSVDFDGASVDGLRESKEGKEEGGADKSDGDVVDDSPRMIDRD